MLATQSLLTGKSLPSICFPAGSSTHTHKTFSATARYVLTFGSLISHLAALFSRGRTLLEEANI